MKIEAAMPRTDSTATAFSLCTASGIGTITAATISTASRS